MKGILERFGLKRITEFDRKQIELARRREEIRKLYREDNLTLHAIGKIHGISKQRVWQIVNSNDE